MKTYDLYLLDNGEDVSVSLRLTGNAIKQLENDVRFGKVSAGEIMKLGMDRISCTMAILDKALNFKGNENKVKDGESLFDLLTENGCGGETNIVRLVIEIARVSGIFSNKVCEQLYKAVEGAFDEPGTENEIHAEEQVENPIS